jgi:hypothetical protein
MLRAQRNFQKALGHNLDLADGKPIKERIAYITENVLACTDELHEALKEVGWKSWATSKHINEKEFFGELRDVWQFLTNLMLAVEPDPEVLAKRLERELFDKLQVNYARNDNGYDGISDKCPSCTRSLSEVAITEVHVDDGAKRYFCVCGSPLEFEKVRPYLD